MIEQQEIDCLRSRRVRLFTYSRNAVPAVAEASNLITTFSQPYPCLILGAELSGTLRHGGAGYPEFRIAWSRTTNPAAALTLGGAGLDEQFAENLITAYANASSAGAASTEFAQFDTILDCDNQPLFLDFGESLQLFHAFEIGGFQYTYSASLRYTLLV